jgi:hypothetical protein
MDMDINTQEKKKKTYKLAPESIAEAISVVDPTPKKKRIAKIAPVIVPIVPIVEPVPVVEPVPTVTTALW